MGKKYTHITEYERIQIEALITAGQSIKEIAEQLNKNYSTIWRELQRGKYIHRNSDWTEEERYSSNIAQNRCEKNKKEHGKGLKIGKDISVVGFDGMDISEFYNPGITTVKQPKREIALKSIELLFDLLKGECENKHLVLETELIERESCGNIIK